MKGMEKLRRKMRMVEKRVIRKMKKEYMFLETNWKTLLHFVFGLFALSEIPQKTSSDIVGRG